jgi:DNA-binding Lrp family transcriptional regulator
MLRAYILIQAEPGQSPAMAGALAGIGGVISVAAVNGPYDLIVLAEASDADDLGQVVLGTIHALRGIVRTLTCPVMRTPSVRHDAPMPRCPSGPQQSQRQPPDLAS